MRRRTIHDLKSSRQTARYIASDPANAEAGALRKAYETLYGHMMIEDVSLGVMPIGGRSTRAGFAVVLDPGDAKVERLIIDGLGRDHSRNLASALADFMRETVMSILAFGEVYREIVYYSEKDSTVPIAFGIDSIPAGTLQKRGSGFIQHISEQDARRQHLASKVQVDPKVVLRFDLPPIMPHHRETLTILRDLSEAPLPQFALPRPGEGRDRVPFDFAAYRRAANLTLARSTREIGWGARGLLNDDMLEYYSMLRFLRFEEFKLALRERALGTLNEGLERIGDRMGFAGQLRIEGLPKRDDISKAYSTLESGPATFKELLDPFLEYKGS